MTSNKESYTIKKDELHPNIFHLQFSYPNQIIINSLIKTKILPGATATNNYKTIQFKANKVQTFKEYQAQNKIENGTEKISITNISKMIITLVTQLKYMINFERRTFLGYNTDNLLIINGNKCVYLGIDYICDIHKINKISETIKTDNILISFPFKPTDFFVSPELLQIKELPSYTHYKTSYFSLGCLIIYILLGNDDFYKEYLNTSIEEEPINIINIINIKDCLNIKYFKDTKLYWFLSRTLEEDPQSRSILFI